MIGHEGGVGVCIGMVRDVRIDEVEVRKTGCRRRHVDEDGKKREERSEDII